MNNENQNIGKREREVVHLLMQGKGNNQIAHELGVSVRTVEYHLGRVYAKLNVASRAEAILKLANAETWEPASQDGELPEDFPVEDAPQTGSLDREETSPPMPPDRNGMDEGWRSRLWIIATIVLAILITGLVSAGILIPAFGWVEPQVATVIVPQVVPQTQIVFATVEVPVIVHHEVPAKVSLTVSRTMSSTASVTERCTQPQP